MVWADNTSHGVAISINPHTPELFILPDSIHVDPLGRYISLNVTWKGQTITIINVYAPVNDSDRADFFSTQLEPLIIAAESHCLIGGDFNCCLSPEQDTINYASFRNWTRSIDTLSYIIDTHNLHDVWRTLNPAASDFTWHRETGLRPSSRLDRLYATPELLTHTSSSSIDHLGISDHSLVMATVTAPPSDPTPRSDSWILNKKLLDSKRTQDTIRKIYSDQTISYEDKKRRLKKNLRRAGIGRATKHRARLQQLQGRLNIYTTMFYVATDPLNTANLRTLITATQHEIDQIRQEEMEGLQIRNRIKYGECEETNFKFHRKQERRKGAQRTIPALRKPDNTTTMDHNEKVEICNAFYTNLYQNRPTCPDAQQTLLNHIHARLSVEQITALRAPITVEEIEAAIKTLPSANKAPGQDGLTNQLYKRFRAATAPNLLQAFMDCSATGQLSTTLSSCTISLLHKKGDTANIGNYRPVSLLNVDYKILAALLAARLNRVLPSLIGSHQHGFVPGRNIHDPINTCQLLIDYSKMTNNDIPTGLLFLDQEKAFDRVDRTYMIRVMTTFGFPQEFINWVQTIYAHTPASIRLNGSLCPSIDLLSGVRQGCPLSPGLYALSIEPLALLINQDPFYQGITIQTADGLLSFRTIMFADDTCCPISGQEDLIRIHELLNIYERGSAAKVNAQKTELLPLGESHFDPESMPFRLLPHDAQVRYLGAQLCNQDRSRELWSHALHKLGTTIAINEARQLSLPTRRRISQTYLISTLRFPLQTSAIPHDLCAKANQLIQNYVLGKSRAFKNRRILELDRQFGGMNLPNLMTINDGYAIIRLKQIVSQTKAWHRLAVHIINMVHSPASPGLNILTAPRVPGLQALPPLLRQSFRAFQKLHGKSCHSPTYSSIRTHPLTCYTKSLAYSHHHLHQVEDLLLHNPPISGATPISPLSELIPSGRRPHDQTHMDLQTALPVLDIPPLFQIRNTDDAYEIQDPTGPTILAVKRRIHEDLLLPPENQLPTRFSRRRFPDVEEIVESPISKRIRRHPRLVTTKTLQVTVNGHTIRLHDLTLRRYYAYTVFSPTHIHSDIWNTLDPPPVWNRLRISRPHPVLPPSINLLRYKISHNALYLGPRTAYPIHPNRTWNPTCCPFCGCTDSLSHAFVDCPAADHLWNLVSEVLACCRLTYDLDIRTKLFGPLPSRRTIHSTVVDILSGLTLHVIWTTRCRWIHDGSQPTIPSIIAIWKSQLSLTTRSLRAAPTHPTHRARLWKIHPKSPILDHIAQWLQSRDPEEVPIREAQGLNG